MRKGRNIVFHPFFLSSLTILLINDLILKSHYPGWLTGKLSDFAGLVVLVFLLCSLRGRDRVTREYVLLVHILLGLSFALLKVLPIDVWLSSLSYRTGIPGGIIVKDVSDLLALAVLPVCYWLLSRRTTESSQVLNSSQTMRALRMGTLSVASFAVLATTPPYYMHETNRRIAIETDVSEARLLFVVENFLLTHGFVIDNSCVWGKGQYSYTIHSKESNWATIKSDGNWFTPKLYDAQLFVTVSPDGRYILGPVKARIGRDSQNAVTDSLIVLNMINPLKALLEAKDEH